MAAPTDGQDVVTEPTVTEPTVPNPAHIFGAIKAVMAQVRGFAKSGQISGGGQRYNFQRYEEMAEKIGELFREQSIMTQVQILDKGRDQWDKPTANGSTRWTNAWVHNAYMFTSLVDGTSVHVEAIGEGADSSDKAFNKAMTSAYKNAFKTAFTLSTKEDDPDDERPEVPGEVHRNDPWGAVTLAAEEAAKAEAAGNDRQAFTDQQVSNVGVAAESLSRIATMDQLVKMRDWAINNRVLQCRTPSGVTFASALLGCKGTVAP